MENQGMPKNKLCFLLFFIQNFFGFSFRRVTIIRMVKIMKIIRLYKDSKFPTEPCDLIVCKGYPNTLTKEQLSFPKIGCINIHTSLLPKYRGRHPIVWAMINQEKEIGVTIHWMDEGIDTGDIIRQVIMPLSVNDVYPLVKARLDYAGEVMLNGVLEEFEAGKFRRVPQDHSKASYLPRRVPADSEIPPALMQDPKGLVAFINALAHPMPNAYLMIDGKKVGFMGATYEE